MTAAREYHTTRRREILEDPQYLHICGRWWAKLVTDTTGVAVYDALLPKMGYYLNDVRMQAVLCKAVPGPGSKEAIEHDYNIDLILSRSAPQEPTAPTAKKRRKDGVCFSVFCASLLEVLDTWTSTTLPAEYIALAADLLVRIFGDLEMYSLTQEYASLERVVFLTETAQRQKFDDWKEKRARKEAERTEQVNAILDKKGDVEFHVVPSRPRTGRRHALLKVAKGSAGLHTLSGRSNTVRRRTQHGAGHVYGTSQLLPESDYIRSVSCRALPELHAPPPSSEAPRPPPPQLETQHTCRHSAEGSSWFGNMVRLAEGESEEVTKPKAKGMRAAWRPRGEIVVGSAGRRRAVGDVKAPGVVPIEGTKLVEDADRKTAKGALPLLAAQRVPEAQQTVDRSALLSLVQLRRLELLDDTIRGVQYQPPALEV